MNRSTLARRYAPLVGVAVLQLLIIGFVPSKAADEVTAGGRSGSAASATGGGGTGTGTATGATIAGGGSAGGGAGGGTGGGGGGGELPPGVEASGDTSHCVNGRTFDPAIAYWAAPCVPGTPGATGVDNGGATWQGVTGEEIVLVDYVSNYGAEVNAILAAQGLLETYEDAVVLDKAWTDFINQHYVLYGRHVTIVPYQGQCQSVPPDYPCLLAEMEGIVNNYHPYAVNWQTTLCSACYAKLASLQTVAVGGTGFSDDLASALAPYFYAAGASATTMEEAFAEFWCSQLSSASGSGRTVRWAGRQNPAQNFNGKPRVLGIISTNDPDNEGTVRDFLVPRLGELCGDSVNHFYFYDQDINTAARQVAAGIAAMNTPTNPATTVLCLCDPVAPAFLFSGEQSNNYYPENVIATNQSMDLDTTGQSYGRDANGGPTLGCPSPQLGCEYDLAFGIGDEGPQAPQGSIEGVNLINAAGGSLPSAITPINATLIARQWIMLANLIQAAGPNLTPAQMAAQSGSLGSLGGAPSTEPLLAFPHGSGYWTQDVRLSYWSPTQSSPYNDRPGTYVQLGDRIQLGGFAADPDGPDIPDQR